MLDMYSVPFRAIFQVVILLIVVAGIRAQEADTCTISALTIRTDAKSLKAVEDNKIKASEIGKIDISQADEGSSYERTIRIPGTTLFAYVFISVDDDMSFHGDLHIAMSVYAVISSSKKRIQRSVLGSTALQTTFDEGFKQFDVTATALKNGRRTAINVLCRVKKPVETNSN